MPSNGGGSDVGSGDELGHHGLDLLEAYTADGVRRPGVSKSMR